MRKTVLDPLDNTQIVLTTDRRIKYDAIRVLRTMYPDTGAMYADSRVTGMRYKTMQWVDLSGGRAAHLNVVYKANGINAEAYSNGRQLCVRVYSVA